MTSRRRTAVPLLAVGLLAAACQTPSQISPGRDLTIGGLLSGTHTAQLADLPCGKTVDVPLGPGRQAFVSVNLQQQDGDRASLAVGAPTALKLPAIGLDPAPALTAPASFEARLRASEARLRSNPPRARKLLQVSTTPRYKVGSEDKFWVISDLSDGNSTEMQVPAKVAYVGAHCYVFVDEQTKDDVTSHLQQIGQTFDTQIFPTDAGLFGEPLASGVNGDPRISLLISPVVGNFGHDTTIGYFTIRDLFAPGADPTDPTLKHSNQRLMLYISPYVIANGQPADYLGTIAHEFQHLINASQKVSHGAPSEDAWLDESLAMFAMEANGYGLSADGSVVFNHVASYLASPRDYSLVDWDDSPDQSSYGAGYLFATYLADRFGPQILKELVASPQTGIANVNARLAPRATNFRQVFEDWTGANLLSGTNLTTDPRYNYRSLNLLGTYGTHRLRGMHLDPVKVPTTGSLSFKAYSAQYLYVAPAANPSLRFNLTGSQSQNFGGLVVSP